MSKTEVLQLIRLFESDVGVERGHLDAANAITVLDGHAHVALLAPDFAPRVPHDPELALLIVLAVANKEDSVVKLVAALS